MSTAEFPPPHSDGVLAMTTPDTISTTHFPCDVCGADDPMPLPHVEAYTGGQPIHVCQRCGLVYVPERRSNEAILQSWTDIYGEGDYSATNNPAVEARLHYCAFWLDQVLGLEGKRIFEIGAGEGRFLEIVASHYGAFPMGLEPAASSVACVEQGYIEDYAGPWGVADIVCILWTLENCRDPGLMLRQARKILKPDGHLLVATGSRLLVPYKKPLSEYLSDLPSDCHATRWTFNSLRNALNAAAFYPTDINPWLSNDILGMIAKRGGKPTEYQDRFGSDSALALANFVTRWHLEWP